MTDPLKPETREALKYFTPHPENDMGVSLTASKCRVHVATIEQALIQGARAEAQVKVLRDAAVAVRPYLIRDPYSVPENARKTGQAKAVIELDAILAATEPEQSKVDEHA
jgi:hypothetical protein